MHKEEKLMCLQSTFNVGLLTCHHKHQHRAITWVTAGTGLPCPSVILLDLFYI